MTYFIFLEFTDPRIREFLRSLRDIFSAKKRPKIPHVTVRGPYKTRPSEEFLEQLRESLDGYGIVVGGAGIFETSKGYSVYLQAQSPVFSELWWKPDYRVKEHGRNPHVTVFETTSLEEAKIVLSFLKKEKIEIYTFNVELTLYRSKVADPQLDFFSNPIELPKRAVTRIQFEKWRVLPGILKRAEILRTTFPK